MAYARARREALEAAAQSLEAEWDPAKHPRGGENPGWFLPTTGAGGSSGNHSAGTATAKVQAVRFSKKPCPPAAKTKSPLLPSAAPSQPKPNAPPPQATPPKGTKDNEYQGLGSWEFQSEEEAFKFFEDLLPAEDRPPRWKAKVALGCVGLNSLRCGDPSGFANPSVAQDTFMRKDAETFKSKAAAEKRLADLQKNNPGKTYYLVAMQINATDTGMKKFDSLGDGPFKHADLHGIIDPTQLGQFNFATKLPLPNGQSCWEWMNHNLKFSNDEPPAVRHGETLPKNYDATFYIVVEKKPWKR